MRKKVLALLSFETENQAARVSRFVVRGYERDGGGSQK
jgi:hypothetical protein